MKQAALLLISVALTSFAFAHPGADSYPGKNIEDSSSVKTVMMQDMLQQVLGVVGLNGNFELKEANVLNIEATISHRKRYILYNPDYISNLSKTTKDKWSVITLLAHEIGHHVNGHTVRRGGSKPELELEADEFAGFVLQKLGASLRESQNVMFYIAKIEASRTHPSRNSRLLAIEKGWKKAAGDNAIIAAAND